MLGRIILTIVCSVIGFVLFPVMILIFVAVLVLGFLSAVWFVIGVGSGVMWWYHPHSHHFAVNTIGFLAYSLGAWVAISLIVALFSGQLFSRPSTDAPFDPGFPVRLPLGVKAAGPGPQTSDAGTIVPEPH